MATSKGIGAFAPIPKRHITANMVQRWFEEATANSRSRAPNADECERLARTLSNFSPSKLLPHPETLGNAESHARKLLKALPAVRTAWEQISARPNVDERTRAWETALQDKLKAAEDAVAELMHASRYYPEMKQSWHATARVIHNFAATAWFQSGIRVPKSLNADDVICKFVTRALLGLGIACGEESVSAALTKRRGPSVKRRTKSSS